MTIAGIVAVDLNGAIGKGGTVPWHYSSDLRFFKQQTMGNACLMGYRTWLSLKKPLRNRLNLVLSRTSEIEPQPSVILLRDRDSALALKDYLGCDLYIIGGEQIYRSFLDDIELWYVTEIPLAVEDADTYMPDNYLQGFVEADSHELEENLRVRVYRRAS